MQANWDLDGNGSDDEDDDPQEEIFYSSDATIFLIEATDSLLAPIEPSAASSSLPPPSTQRERERQFGVTNQLPATKLEQCLLCAYKMMRRKAMSAPRDRLGVVIFNTENTIGLSSTPASTKRHYMIVQELGLVTADSLGQFKDLLTDAAEDPEFLSKTYAVNKSPINSLTQALSLCSDLFRRNASSNRINKKILLITDNDEPFPPNSPLRGAANTKRKDLAQFEFRLEPYFFSQSSKEFDLENFYGDFITKISDDDMAQAEDDDESDVAPAWPVVRDDLGKALIDLVDGLRTKEAMKRTQFQIPFILAEGTTIGVKGYALIGLERLRLPTKVDLNTTNADAVVHKIYYKDQITGEEIDVKTEVRKYFQVGQSNPDSGAKPAQIFFSEAEVRKIKSLGRRPSLQLLGFVPRAEFLKFEETIKHAYFLRPDEDAWTGSTRTFTSLMESMNRKGVIGYASFLSRVSARPQIVVIDAQEEELDKFGATLRPAGLNVYQLPFVDDIRMLGLEGLPSVINMKPTEAGDDERMADDTEQDPVNLARSIVRKLKKKYYPDATRNPAIDFFNNTLAATALGDELPEPEDATIPAYANIAQRAGSMIRQLKEIIGEDKMDPTLVKTSNKKRPLGASDRPATSTSAGTDEEVQDFRNALTELEDRLTVAQLKEGLKTLGEKTSGRKDELIERAIAALTRRGLWVKAEVDEDDEAGPRKKAKN